MGREYNFNDYISSIAKRVSEGRSFIEEVQHFEYIIKNKEFKCDDLQPMLNLLEEGVASEDCTPRVIVKYMVTYALVAIGDTCAEQSIRELWDTIRKEGEVELCRRDKTLFEEKMEVGDLHGVLADIYTYLKTPAIDERLSEWAGVEPEDMERDYISRRDNIICFFEQGAPVIVKVLDEDGRYCSTEQIYAREPYYRALPKPKFESAARTLFDPDESFFVNDEVGYVDPNGAAYKTEYPRYNRSFVSPIYQVVKASKILAEALLRENFVSKPVRKIIVASNYKEIFDNPQQFEQQCTQSDIELYCDKTKLYAERGFPYDFRYASQWYSALGVTEHIYRTFRSVDSDFIRDIIEELYGDSTPKGYEKQLTDFMYE